LINKNSDIVVCEALRSLFKFYQKNELQSLSSAILKALLERTSMPAEMVGEIIICGVDRDIINSSELKFEAGILSETPSINLCGKGISPLQSIKIASMLLKQGEIDCAIVAGISSRAETQEEYIKFRQYCDRAAAKHNIERIQQDEWTLRSHSNYAEYLKSGNLSRELYNSSTGNADKNTIYRDLQFRENISLDQISKTEPFMGLSSITEYNSANSDMEGAAALLITTRQQAAELRLEPLATIVATGAVSTGLSDIAETQAAAIQMVCKKANLNLDDMNVININEDFAALPIINLKVLSGDDITHFENLSEKTNINGGALSFGNPGYSIGFQILMNTIFELRRSGGNFGLCTVNDRYSQAEGCIIRA